MKKSTDIIKEKTTPQEAMTSELDKTFLDTLSNEKKNYITTRSSKVQPVVAEKILADITEAKKLDSPQQAKAFLAMFFQQGGTARSCNGNMSITLFGKEMKLAEIKKILKANNCNKAERKLARTLADDIQLISKIMEIPGNLYLKIQKFNLERAFSTEEKVWLSDFQSDNENCPTALRKLIHDTFKKKTNNKNEKSNRNIKK